MTVRNNSVLSAVRSAPFTVKIAPNGYTVRDNRDYVWATCRDEGYAKIIVEGLHKLAASWEAV